MAREGEDGTLYDSCGCCGDEFEQAEMITCPQCDWLTCEGCEEESNGEIVCKDCAADNRD